MLRTKDGIKIGKWLTCGCCGMDFKVWPEYADQDQDAGYGICMSCQGFAEEKEKEEMDKAIDLLLGALNEENSAKFAAMDRGLQEALVFKAIDDGVIGFSIKGRA
jgi:hypothetical protein